MSLRCHLFSPFLTFAIASLICLFNQFCLPIDRRLASFKISGYSKFRLFDKFCDFTLHIADWLKPAATKNALSGLVSRPKSLFVAAGIYPTGNRQITTDQVPFMGKESFLFDLIVAT